MPARVVLGAVISEQANVCRDTATSAIVAQCRQRLLPRQAGRRRLKRGVLRSLVDLKAAIKRFLPKPTTAPDCSSGVLGFEGLA